ncbi:hypothetical protein OD90_1612 [Dokdonia sp. Hel_I_53]|nr:hypothetical protein OD90_1612 [Dokdonia sp. Hel_I_53]
MGMFHYYDLGISEVFVFDEFLVNQIREGVVITPAHNIATQTVIDQHFANKPVVYISNRHFSYTVDPLTYIETSKIHNLVGIAIVSDQPDKQSTANYESSFYKKPFEIFNTLSEAMEWVHKVVLVNENSNKKTRKIITK